MIASDLFLIEKIKNNQDSSALQELANRHTGIYVSTVKSYSYLNPVDQQDLIDHKLLNIYNAVLAYKPEKEMKFSTFVGQNIKWECQRMISKKAGVFEEVADSIQDDTATINRIDGEFSIMLMQELSQVEDKRFVEIFRMRHLQDPKNSWREIGTKLNISYECARKIYKKNIGYIKEKIKE